MRTLTIITSNLHTTRIHDPEKTFEVLCPYASLVVGGVAEQGTCSTDCAAFAMFNEIVCHCLVGKFDIGSIADDS